jgi:transcriptional regulator of acetoin/glycerol metabolism
VSGRAIIEEVESEESTEPGSRSRDARGPRQAGALLVWAGGAPRHVGWPLVDGRLTLGRAALDRAGLADRRVSRRHLVITQTAGGFTVEDLGSRNGTTVNGQPAVGKVKAGPRAVVRAGDTLLVLVEDLDEGAPPAPSSAPGVVLGPAARSALARVRELAATSDTLLIQGESGVGKELAARAFHEAGPHAAGPFVAVNCATIPEGIAERLLFGAVRGAFSGATAAVGYVEAAAGGVLFLDEVGELHPGVQAKLLRVLETREVVPLGATEPRRVELGVCSATLTDLHAAVTAGRFRADLYYRLARRVVLLPPLRERLEEIPWLAAGVIASVSGELTPHPSLVEKLLLQPWRGNVRELQSTVRAAAEVAARRASPTVDPAHLPDAPRAPEDTAARRAEPSADDLRAAISAHGGNLSAAARALRLHRSQLYRLLRQHGLRAD